MTTRLIQIHGKPTSTVELKVEWAAGCFETVTFSKGVPVNVLVIVEKDNEETRQMAESLEAIMQYAADWDIPTVMWDKAINAIKKAKGE
jgi:DhnA family fructose-bisphosphate aldolase class Ia